MKFPRYSKTHHKNTRRLTFSSALVALLAFPAYVKSHSLYFSQTKSVAIAQGETCWEVFLKDYETGYWTDPGQESLGKYCVTGVKTDHTLKACVAGRLFNTYVGPTYGSNPRFENVDVNINGQIKKGTIGCHVALGFSQCSISVKFIFDINQFDPC
jgi:hypothetical protein